MRLLLAFIIIGSLIVGCAPKMEKEKSAEQQEKIISKDEAVGALPCFKCHSYQRFSSEPRKGIFPHTVHMNTGYHCNQCHTIEGHKRMTINRDICGNCHNIKVISLKKTIMPSRFNHESHSKLFGCKECHSKIFLMKAGTAHISMKDINAGEYCGACHNGKKAFPSSECNKCHDLKGFNRELLYHVKGFGPVTFSHKFHAGSFPCEECHPRLFSMKRTQGKMTMEKINEGKFCGACHNGNIASPASECNKCHK